MTNNMFDLWDGIVMTLQMSIDDAIQYFNSDTILHRLHKSEVLFLRAVLTEDDEHIKETIEMLSEVQKMIGDKTSVGYSFTRYFGFGSKDHVALEDTELEMYHTVNAYVDLLRAGLLFRKGSYVNGATTIRKSWKGFESVFRKSTVISRDVDDDFDEFELYTRSTLFMGMGIFYFFISLVPSTFLWIIKTIGFKENRIKGLQYFSHCFSEKGHRSPFAGLVLFWIQSFYFEDKYESERYFKLCQELVPDCPYYYYLGGYITRKGGDIDLAMEQFNYVHEISHQLRVFQLTSIYEIGWCLFLKLDWEGCIHHFEEFLNEWNASTYKSYCAYQLGMAYFMMKKEKKARKWFVEASNWTRKGFSFDEYAKKRGKQYLKYGFTKYQKELFIIEITINAKKWDHAKYLLDESRILSRGTSEDIAVWHYFYGKISRNLNLTEDAVSHFKMVIEAKKDIKLDVYILPHSLTELGEIFFEGEDLESAKDLFKKAKEYSNYAFDKPLSRRVSKNLDLIKVGSPFISRNWNNPDPEIDLLTHPINHEFISMESISDDDGYAEFVDEEYKSLEDEELYYDDLVKSLRGTNGVFLSTKNMNGVDYHSCCTGRELFEWIQKSLSLPEEKIVSMCQSLIGKQKLQNIGEPDPLFDLNNLYQFYEDIDQGNIFNKSKIWILPKREISVVINHLNSLIYQLYNTFLDLHEEFLDLKTLKQSGMYRVFNLATCELQSVEISTLQKNEKTSFFINIYNLLVIHANVSTELPSKDDRFFEETSYIIGDQIYSLNDIEHGILRGNSPPVGSNVPQFSNDNPKIKHSTELDPRIHFALNCGALSCPKLKLIEPENFDEALSFLSSKYVQENIEIDAANNKVTLPMIFKWFSSDFGSTTQAILDFISQYANEELLDDIGRLDPNDISIIYGEYDWTFMYKL